MNLDSPEAVGGGLAVLLGAAFKALTAYLEWRNKQEQKRASKIPPSPQYQPPETDPHALRRMDLAEYESALSVALVRERGFVDDLRRELAETRAERDRLEIELRHERALTAMLRAEIRAKNRRGAVEVSAAEHRDASQSGTLQDALRTPLRPPKR